MITLQNDYLNRIIVTRIGSHFILSLAQYFVILFSVIAVDVVVQNKRGQLYNQHSSMCIVHIRAGVDSFTLSISSSGKKIKYNKLIHFWVYFLSRQWINDGVEVKGFHILIFPLFLFSVFAGSSIQQHGVHTTWNWYRTASPKCDMEMKMKYVLSYREK